MADWHKVAGIPIIALGIILVIAWLALPSTYAPYGGFSEPPIIILDLGVVMIPIGVFLFYLGHRKEEYEV
jgi:hypothetical protein